jgi:hypothetical protein
MATASLIQLIHVSEAARPLTQPDLLEVSVEYNRLRDITGILLYYKASFFQVLEGDAETVGKLSTSRYAKTRATAIIPS